MGEAVRETYVSVPTANGISLCAADPTRRFLMIAVPVGQACNIGLSLAIKGGIGSQGVSISAGLPFTLSTRDNGLLTCLQWYGVSTGSGFTIAVYEVYDPSISYPPTAQGGVQPLGSLTGVGGSHENDMSTPDPIHEMIVQLARLTRKLRG